MSGQEFKESSLYGGEHSGVAGQAKLKMKRKEADVSGTSGERTGVGGHSELKRKGMEANVCGISGAQHVEEFIDAIADRSRSQSGGGITDHYRGIKLTKPSKEFTPQLQKISLHRGDWIEQFPQYKLHQFSGQAMLGRQEEYLKEKEFPFRSRKKEDVEISIEEFLNPSKQCRMRVLTGQAGSGKTTLMKRIARDFMDKTITFQSKDKDGEITTIELVHFINIRDISMADDINACDLLFTNFLPFLQHETIKAGFQWVMNNQRKVVFVMDGLDQAPWSLTKPPFLDLNQQADQTFLKQNTSKIMYNLLHGEILPNIQIILSSREHSIVELPKEIQPNLIAALAGFSKEETKQLFIQLAGENGEKLWELLCIQSPSIVTICSIPVFLLFTVIAYKSNPQNLPDTMSGIMVNILQIFMRSDHQRGPVKFPEILQKLKQLALEGTQDRKVIFTIDELKEINLIPKSVQDLVIFVPGSTIFSQQLMERDYRVFFCHQSIQEMLAALAIAEKDVEDFQDFVTNNFKEGHWSVVRRFLCGILLNQQTCDDACMGLLEADELEKKREILKHHLQHCADMDRLEFYTCLDETNNAELGYICQEYVQRDMYFVSSAFRRCQQFQLKRSESDMNRPDQMPTTQEQEFPKTAENEVKFVSTSCQTEESINEIDVQYSPVQDGVTPSTIRVTSTSSSANIPLIQIINYCTTTSVAAGLHNSGEMKGITIQDSKFDIVCAKENSKAREKEHLECCEKSTQTDQEGKTSTSSQTSSSPPEAGSSSGEDFKVLLFKYMDLELRIIFTKERDVTSTDHKGMDYKHRTDFNAITFKNGDKIKIRLSAIEETSGVSVTPSEHSFTVSEEVLGRDEMKCSFGLKLDTNQTFSGGIMMKYTVTKNDNLEDEHPFYHNFNST